MLLCIRRFVCGSQALGMCVDLTIYTDYADHVNELEAHEGLCCVSLWLAAIINFTRDPEGPG
jgi:hypothetical protein